MIITVGDYAVEITHDDTGWYWVAVGRPTGPYSSRELAITDGVAWLDSIEALVLAGDRDPIATNDMYR